MKTKSRNIATSAARWVALCGLLATTVLAVSCADTTSSSSATLRVRVQNVMSQTEIELPSGNWILIAQGRAEDDISELSIQAYDHSGRMGGAALITLANDLTGAHNGDTGFGRMEVLALEGSVQDITIPFAWNAGAQVDSGWNLGLDFSRGPDLNYWSVTPAPYILDGANVNVLASFSSDTDEPADIITWLEVGDSVHGLNYDTGLNLYTGSFIAAPGVWEVSIWAMGSGAGETFAAKDIVVFPAGVDAMSDDQLATYAGRADRQATSATESVLFTIDSDGSQLHLNIADTANEIELWKDGKISEYWSYYRVLGELWVMYKKYIYDGEGNLIRVEYLWDKGNDTQADFEDTDTDDQLDPDEWDDATPIPEGQSKVVPLPPSIPA